MMAHLQRDSLVDQLKPGSRDVIGSDDRKRVRDATLLPFRWVCQVLGEDIDTRRLSVGSGFLIGRRVIITAAHNLWAKANRVDQFLVLCGLEGDHQSPRLGSYKTRKAIPHPKYVANRNSAYDIAVIVLEEPLSASIGVVPWESVDPNLLVGLKGAISGYPRYGPGEKDKENSPINAHQWYDIASLTQSGGQLFYTADTSAGQSGCPVLVARPSPSTGVLESTAVGVHIRGVESSLGNQAVPFHSELTEFIQTQLSTFESRSSA